MSGSNDADDLEQTLMLAAAAADSRQYEDDADNPEEIEEKEDTQEEIKYYTEIADTSANYGRPLKRNHEEILPDEDSSKTQEKDGIATANSKRRHEEDSQVTSSSACYNHTQIVASHYNLLKEKGLDERSRSRIVYLRNFHNWIKSMLINEYLTKIKDSKKQHNPPVRVHDMCCGKGGDLFKWKKGAISHLVCSDIAEVSLEHCKQRYADMKQRSRYDKGGSQVFSLEVLPAADCTEVRLREKFSDPSIKLDLVSCQFAFHYSFESLPQAECMIRNASECLQPGGYFIGTVADANEIVARARKSKTASFGNEVYQVTLEFDTENPPLFGAKYNFQMDEVVNNCPEFLVHFPTFVKLAKKYGLRLVKKEKFSEFFERMRNEGKQLLSNMRALECYPPYEGATLLGIAQHDYDHAKEFVKKENRGNSKIGTLSKSEWEASSLYLTFAFEKVKNTWNPDGTPCYLIT